MTYAEPSPPPRTGVAVRSAAPHSSALTVVVIGVVVVLSLYFGQSILVPLAVAILLSFALAPLVSRLRRWRVPRIPAVIAAVLFAMSLLAGVFTIVGFQVVDLARNLPQYEDNLVTKIRALRPAPSQDGLVAQTTEVLKHLGEEIKTATGADAPPPDTASEEREEEPLRVQIEPPPSTPFQVLKEFGGPIVAPLGGAGMVLLFTIFILLQQEDLRDRLIRLAGAQDLKRTTETLGEAAERVSRYLVTHLTLNLLYGIPVGVGLWLLGIPNAALWGLLATVLRFIPFLGPVIAAMFPIALSIAVDPGWTLPLMVLALVAAIELFSNNVLEPWLYGASTGLSPFAVIVAAIFWTSLWGPVGLLLATPLTVVLVVLGRHVPQLKFLEVLLGNKPVLPPEARVYQRLLARDPTEAGEIIDESTDEDETPAAAHDRLLLGALRLAEQDRTRGALDEETLRTLQGGVEELVEDLGGDASAEVERVPGVVLCIAGRSHLDEATAMLLGDMLRRQGYTPRVLPCEAVSPRRITLLDRSEVRAVVVCYLTTGSGRHAARMLSRLRRQLGADVPILLGLWDGGEVSGPPGRAGPEGQAGTLQEAAAQVRQLLPPPALAQAAMDPDMAPPPQRPPDPDEPGERQMPAA